MTRMIKLLPGSRSSQNDVGSIDSASFRIAIADGETDHVSVDCERWLGDATVASVSSSADFIAQSFITAIISLVIVGSNSTQCGDITITDSDGRVRIVTIEACPVGGSSTFQDYF